MTFLWFAVAFINLVGCLIWMDSAVEAAGDRAPALSVLSALASAFCFIAFVVAIASAAMSAA